MSEETGEFMTSAVDRVLFHFDRFSLAVSETQGRTPPAQISVRHVDGLRATARLRLHDDDTEATQHQQQRRRRQVHGTERHAVCKKAG